MFDTEMFADCIPKKVEFLPPTINGNKVYEVLNCNRYNYSKKTTDRRWFLMTTSVKNSFHGIRKVGFCQGSPCVREPYLLILLNTRPEQQMALHISGCNKVLLLMQTTNNAATVFSKKIN